MKENIVQVVESEEEQISYSDNALFNIASFGTDMTFRELITMYNEGDLEKPELQRKYVWSKKEASRFIDSILLGLPVPSIFLAKTPDDRRLIVDGYQRIMTVYDYVQNGVFGGDGKPFKLSNTVDINENWRGKMFNELSREEQRRIKNFPIHAIIFEQREPKNDTGMYQIFERINTSGRPLKPQEIRNCVYHGTFNKLLIELNGLDAWKKVLNIKGDDSRMGDIELILRALAFSDFSHQKESEKNQINLVKYLNNFMGRNSDISTEECDCMKEKFVDIISILSEEIGPHIFRNAKMVAGQLTYAKKINPVILDSVFAATAFIWEKGRLQDLRNGLLSNYDLLIADEDYQEVIRSRTTTVENIKSRILIATRLLFGVEYEW